MMDTAATAAGGAPARRARKVRFYRNGDRHYAGYLTAVSTERYRTFDALLNDLTHSQVCDRNVLPQGVRFLFNLTGQRVRGLHELADGASYVCASFDQFKRLGYGAPAAVARAKADKQKSQPHPLVVSQQLSQAASQVKPRVVSILAGGGAPRPRRAARVLLNGRTAKSFDRVMADISQAVGLPSGAVRRLYNLDGKLVTQLDDLLGNASVFIAYGNEKMNSGDFILDETDCKLINPQARAHVKASNRQRPVGSAPGTPAVAPPATTAGHHRQRRIRPGRDIPAGLSSPLAEEAPASSVPPGGQSPGSSNSSINSGSSQTDGSALADAKASGERPRRRPDEPDLLLDPAISDSNAALTASGAAGAVEGVVEGSDVLAAAEGVAKCRLSATAKNLESELRDQE